ncbi:UNVERIFIED_CONTAM: hypothetical protein PYX00_009328 [Menopon gallinae]|uniref:YLP motif-containing protein 1 n=1 Tax=Menopon gallinae TaxID=328185 RepID=A0AAW2HB12_9NEOP
MQNQPWSWGQPGASSFPTGPVFPSGYPPPSMDQSQLISGYQQMYGAPPSQPPPDYGTSQWSAAQLQHWQQWQQWQEKYQQWQAQYGKKYAETIAAMSQNPNVLMPGVQPPLTKPNEAVTNPGYTTVNPPPPPSNTQPVPPPPPEEDKPAGTSGKDRESKPPPDSNAMKDNVEELSEAEKTFDIQFKQWEDQFNEWKKQNQDHPDKAQYREYEKKWETWREQLLQRREQMRKKRISKISEMFSESSMPGKSDELKGKEELQGKTEPGNNCRTGGNQEQTNSDSKSVASYNQEGHGMYQQYKPPDGGPGNFAPFPNLEGNFLDGRIPGYFDRENPNFGGSGPPFGFGGFDSHSKLRSIGMDNREKEFTGVAQRFDNSSRGDFPPRRPFGNGSFEEDRNFGPRFGHFDHRKPGPDRFCDRMKDGKFNTQGRDFGPGGQLNEQAFSSTGRNFQDRNFPGDMKPPFVQTPTKNNVNNTYSKPKVPSLFDITVEKPPGLKSPGKDRKSKIWEQDKSFDGSEKDEKNMPRNDGPWLSNATWASNNSPWIKPWELDRVVAEKPPDANLRPDAWQREPVRGDEKPWASELMKSDMDKSELSGYVGKILAKLGNFNVLPPKEGFMGDNSGKVDENMDGKLPPLMQGQNWPNRNDRNAPFAQDNPNYPGSFGRDRFDEPPKFGPQSDQKDNRTDDVVLFGRGDCDDRIRFDPGRDNRRDDRNFCGNEPFRREDRGPYPEEGRHLPSRSMSDDDRFFGKGERNSFGRDDRPGAKVGLDDVDERMLRNRDRNGRRGFDDRDDRGFMGMYDRDDRRARNFGSPFDKFGRSEQSPKEPEWNPQVFDYSKGNQTNFRSRFSGPEDNFHISTVVDYSHGENKQTFDYAHGEVKNENLPVTAFEYGHGRESPAVIDYGHGSDRDHLGPQKWRKESQDKTGEKGRSRSKSKSPQRRSRSPRGRPRSRSRSPYSGPKSKTDPISPTFRGHRSRSRDRFNRLGAKRNRRNNSEEKAVQGADGDVTKNNFDITTVLVEDLICSPGRETRPSKLVFIMRGLPGSGKTYVTKLIKDKEVELGGDAPRILSLDDYFMTEVEKEVVDEETGRKLKKKVLEYEYESCAEPHYRGSLLKAFKKTVSDGFFSFIIVDSVNEKTKDYEEMWSFAKSKGFQVYVAEMDDDVAVCTKRNIHKRTEKEISDLAKAWEKTPNHYLRLDVRSLLQADAITEVEMEVVSDTDLDKIIDAEEEKGKEAEDTKEDEEEVAVNCWILYVDLKKGRICLFIVKLLPPKMYHLIRPAQNVGNNFFFRELRQCFPIIPMSTPQKNILLIRWF